MSFAQGDIIWVSLDPAKGNEQAKRRPVLVVSGNAFNQATNLIWVVPITSKAGKRGQELYLPESMQTQGRILLSQMRAVDPQARQVEYIENLADQNLLAEILASLIAVYDYDPE